MRALFHKGTEKRLFPLLLWCILGWNRVAFSALVRGGDVRDLVTENVGSASIVPCELMIVISHMAFMNLPSVVVLLFLDDCRRLRFPACIWEYARSARLASRLALFAAQALRNDTQFSYR